jgi:hypothetical protein
VGFGASLEFKMEILKVVKFLLTFVKDLRECEEKPLPLSLWQHTETSSEFTCCYQPGDCFFTVNMEYCGDGTVELYVQTLKFGLKGLIKTFTKFGKQLLRKDVTVEYRVERDKFTLNSSPVDLDELYLEFKVKETIVLVLNFTARRAKIDAMLSEMLS